MDRGRGEGRGILGLAAVLIPMGLACGGAPPSTEHSEVAPPVEGPSVLELVAADDACAWVVHHGAGLRQELLSHEGPCPGLSAMAMGPRGTPAAAGVGNRVVLSRNGESVWIDGPPDGDLVRVGFDGEDLVAATLLEIEGTGPHDYAGESWTWEASDGIYALAIRWKYDGKAWTQAEIATTTTGWDLGLGTDALQAPLPVLEEPGEQLRGLAKEVDDDKGLVSALNSVAGKTQREGWFVAETPNGRVAAGWMVGEFIHATGPILLERNGVWVPLAVEGAGMTNVRARLTDDRLLVQVYAGDGVVVDLKSGEVLVRSENALALLP